MKRVYILMISALSLTLSLTSFMHVKYHCDDWGFFGHKKINELAVFTLPEEMFGFYKDHIEYLIEHSVDPDKRRYGVVGEAECHYIDMDRYITSEQSNPFKNVPRRWKDAVEKYSEDTLRAHGIVPWHIYLMYSRLTDAFRNEDIAKILRLSAEIGHYIGDSHVPLHSTSNYNGQKTNQRGIHGFWESRVPELFSDEYDFLTGKAFYISAPQYFIWDRLEESFAATDSVLRIERELTESFGEDKKFTYETRGLANMKVYTEEFSRAYSERLDGQVERRMKQAIISVGSFWYTAWVDAGQPKLGRKNQEMLSDADSTITDAGKLQVREHE